MMNLEGCIIYMYTAIVQIVQSLFEILKTKTITLRGSEWEKTSQIQFIRMYRQFYFKRHPVNAFIINVIITVCLTHRYNSCYKHEIFLCTLQHQYSLFQNGEKIFQKNSSTENSSYSFVQRQRELRQMVCTEQATTLPRISSVFQFTANSPNLFEK